MEWTKHWFANKFQNGTEIFENVMAFTNYDQTKFSETEEIACKIAWRYFLAKKNKFLTNAQ